MGSIPFDSMIKISNIFVTQRNLKRKNRIPSIINSIEKEEYFDPIEVQQLPDNSIEIVNGHHRLTAYYLFGIENLNKTQYNIKCVDESYKHRFGKITNLLKREGIKMIKWVDEILKDKNLTLENMQKSCNLSNDVVKRIFNRQWNPTKTQKIMVSNFLNTKPEEIIFGNDHFQHEDRGCS